jgi:hypothetical protein
MKKFTETTWRFTFYFCVFTYGLIVLFDVSLISNEKKTTYCFLIQIKFSYSETVVYGPTSMLDKLSVQRLGKGNILVLYDRNGFLFILGSITVQRC